MTTDALLGTTNQKDVGGYLLKLPHPVLLSSQTVNAAIVNVLMMAPILF